MQKDMHNIIISPNISIRNAMKVISEIGFRCVLVVDHEWHLIGVVTDGDIRKHILKEKSLDLSVRMIMNIRPIVLKEGYSLKEARDIMIRNSITLIPIVDKSNKVKDYLHLPDVILELETNGEIKKDDKNRKQIRKLLVIGGAGYIGSVLVRRLLEAGYKTRVMDILLYGDGSIKELYSCDNFEFIRGDCRNIQDVIRAMDGIDAVVHLGEIVGDPACSLNPDFTIEVNYMATKAIAEACCYCGISRFIFSSSCSVYGASDNEVDEGSSLNPISLYARCKVESEKAILSIKDENFSPVVLRFATTYGFSYRPRFDLAINLLSAKAIKENRIQIFGGRQWRPFVSVDDVAEAVLKALRAEENLVRREIFNVGSNQQNYQLYSVAEFIKEAVPGITVDVEEKIQDKRNYRVRFDKIRSCLGFICKTNVIDEIARMKEYLCKERDIDIYDPRFSNYRTFVSEEVPKK